MQYQYKSAGAWCLNEVKLVGMAWIDIDMTTFIFLRLVPVRVNVYSN